MTTSDEHLNRGEAPEIDTGEVGYRKPPKAHRFAKGTSGNPGGKRKVKPCAEAVPRLPAESLHEMLMLETRRMVRVKAGGQTIEIPAIQAAYRETMLKAAKGNRLAMERMTRLAMLSEATERKFRPRDRQAARRPSPAPRAPTGEIAAAEEYREVWTRVLTRAEEQGIDVPTPEPHPDEVTIGRVRGTVRWPGQEEGETLSMDAMAVMHAELQNALPKIRRTIEAMDEGVEKADAWCRWFAGNDLFGLIEHHLPERYAGQIDDEEPSPEERLRDRSLRAMAEHDRDWFAREREEAEAEAEEAAEATLAEAEEADWAEADEDEDRLALPEPEPEEPPEPAVTPEQEREAMEATIYRDAWTEALAAVEGSDVKFPGPEPHPDDVIIDAEAPTVTYRVPPVAGRLATEANLRAQLGVLRAELAVHRNGVAHATSEHFAAVARRKLEVVMAVCRVIEEWLAEVGMVR